MEKTQKFTIRENTDFNSLEISFTGIPDSETRSTLKALGFRWNPKKSLWYGYADRETLEKYGYCIGGYERMYLTNCTNRDIANISMYDDHSYKLGFKRYLTDDEAQEIKKLVELLKADYIKRLKTYYKRYGDKITTHGYWANR